MKQTPGANKVPITGLRKRYLRLGYPGVSTRQRRQECDELTSDVTPLVNEFVKALDELRSYDRREDPFYPDHQRKTTARLKKGATEMFGKLEEQGQPVSVLGIPAYSFIIVDREINPLRTVGVRSPDGTPASRKGRVGGGLDYVGLLEGPSRTPILGEIKAGSDKDTYYAFVQLLTYLSELSTPAQLARANKHLFKGKLAYPARYDLHILLADYNDRGQRGPIIESTHNLAVALKVGLTAAVGGGHTLGRVLCLKATVRDFADSLEVIWAV